MNSVRNVNKVILWIRFLINLINKAWTHTFLFKIVVSPSLQDYLFCPNFKTAKIMSYIRRICEKVLNTVFNFKRKKTCLHVFACWMHRKHDTSFLCLFSSISALLPVAQNLQPPQMSASTTTSGAAGHNPLLHAASCVTDPNNPLRVLLEAMNHQQVSSYYIIINIIIIVISIS